MKLPRLCCCSCWSKPIKMYYCTLIYSSSIWTTARQCIVRLVCHQLGTCSRVWQQLILDENDFYCILILRFFDSTASFQQYPYSQSYFTAVLPDQASTSSLTLLEVIQPTLRIDGNCHILPFRLFSVAIIHTLCICIAKRFCLTSCMSRLRHHTLRSSAFTCSNEVRPPLSIMSCQ